MSPSRIAIYVSPPLAQLLDSHLPEAAAEDDGAPRSRSALLAAVADRYQALVREAMPALPLEQWLLIFDALNGVWMQEPASLAVNGLPLEVADAVRLNRLHDKWGVGDREAAALVDRLYSAPFAERLAIVDAAERFWARDVQPEADAPGDHPHACWRAPVRALVGAAALGDDEAAVTGA